MKFYFTEVFFKQGKNFMPQDVNSEKKRIEWVDFFKGILICLVVIGHATGRFNGWIYQFHVGAFFMISGFTSKREKENSLKKIFLRFYTLQLPLITSFLILLPIVKLLTEFNIYKTFFNYDFIGIKTALSHFFLYGNNHINWLGAGWFLPVLFGISVLDEILIQFNMNKTPYFFVSLLIYLFGFVLVHINFHGNNCITVVLPKVFVCYGFYAIGNLFKTISKFDFLKKSFSLALIFIVNCTLLYYFKKIKPTVMDIESCRMPSEFITMLLVTNGFMLLYSVSNIFFILKNKFNIFIYDKVSNFFQYVGKNTLGILLFHFMFFKIPYVLLYILGKIPKDNIALLVPDYDIGCKWWWLISTTSIFLSLFLWVIIKKIPVLNFLFGFRKDIALKIFNYTCHTKRQKIENKNISFFSKLDKKIVFCFVLFVLSISIIYIKTGISHNDELQSRFWGMLGFSNLIKHYKEGSIAQGRFLAMIPYCISFFINFFNSNYFIYKTISFAIILLDVILFSHILWILIKDEFFSLLFCILFLLSLMIFPDNTIPNVFVGFMGISLAIFFCSILCFIDYLIQQKKNSLIISCCCLFYVLCSYEVYLTLTPLYLACALFFQKDYEIKTLVKIKNAFTKIIFPFATSVIYLFLYVISSKLFPSNYDGNHIAITSLKEPIRIIIHLLKVSLPGGLVLTNSYHYLSQLFNPLAGKPLLSQVIYFSTTSTWLIIMCCAWIIQKKCMNNDKTTFFSSSSFIKCILFAFIFSILPSIPISISKMYQNNIGEKGFLTLPVTYISKFATVSALTVTVYYTTKKLNSRFCFIFVNILLLFYFGNIQMKNIFFGNELFKQYNRLTNIEKLFDTEEIKKLNGKNILCPDLYETRHKLSVHDGYWSSYASMLKRNTANFVKSTKYISPDASLYYINDEYFCIAFEDGNFTVLSPKELPSGVILKNINGFELYSKITNKRKDGDFFVYNTYIEMKKQEIQVGNNLESASSKYGIYADSWVASDFGMKIYSGELGTIEIDGLFPFDYFEDKNINIYINDILVQSYRIQSNNFSISVPAVKNEIIDLKVNSELKVLTTNGDTRDLSFILKDVRGR